MVSTNDLDTGMAIYLDDELYLVENYEHSRKARGSAFVRTRLRKVSTGEVHEENLPADEEVEQAYLDSRPAEYLYDNGDFHVFMDMETYDQVELSEELLGDKALYLRENLELRLEYCDEDPIGITLPDSMVLTVADTDPGVKGNTAQGGTKPATTHTGLTVDVPLFIDEGEAIKVRTDDGEYVERADDNE